MDVGRHALPAALKSIQLHALPIVIALPARAKVCAKAELRHAVVVVAACSRPSLYAAPLLSSTACHGVQEAPFSFFDGKVRPKEMMYFLQRHATSAFELPPNPHLSREQHELWKVQVAELPSEKVEAAYQSLERETGLARDEL